MGVKLLQLRYVIATAQHGGIRRAARALGVDPGTISRRIRNLEDEVGASLFTRGQAGTSLTFAGEQFVERARNAVMQVEYAKQHAGVVGKGQAGVVRIGLTSTIASGFLAELVGVFSENHPNVRIDYLETDGGDYLPAIRQHNIDVVFITGDLELEGCDVVHLWDERIYVAMSAGHGLAGKDFIRWSDLRGHEFIVSEVHPGGEVFDYIIKHLSEFGSRPIIRRQAVYRDTLMQIVATGCELTLANEAMITAQVADVVYRPLVGEVLPFYAVWSPSNDNPPFRRFRSLAMQISKKYCVAPL